MKLIILIISPIDFQKVINYLDSEPIFYLKIASSGGIVTDGNHTLLIKTLDDACDEIIKKISSLCKIRRLDSSCDLIELSSDFNSYSYIGGGTIFVINLEQFIKV